MNSSGSMAGGVSQLGITICREIKFFQYIYYRNLYYEFPPPVTELFSFRAEWEEHRAEPEEQHSGRSFTPVVPACDRLEYGDADRAGAGPPKGWSRGG